MSPRAASQAPDLPGYEYERVLGSGGFSDVFLYQQRLPRRKVAVKVLLTDELNSQARSQFAAEANLMAQLSTHPYIVTIYQADVAGDDRPYFVMEYCSGPSLADRYKRQPLGVDDSLRIGVRVAGAVATAHAAGILHRDIKPANVLTNDFGWPALTDFGISSTLEGELPTHTMSASAIAEAAKAAGDSTNKQSVGMSVPWSPPEMFEDDPRPDVRSDVFSLAATIYTVLAGHTPFEVPGRPNGTLDLIGRIERGAVTPLERSDVPRSLVAILNKGMASRRDDRFATAVDFARALQRVELELGYAPTNIEVPNLGVAEAAHQRDTSAPEDETRVRSVATIVAQPKRTPPPPPKPSPETVGPLLEPTRMRGAMPVVHPDAAPPLRASRASVDPVEHTMLRPSDQQPHAPTQTIPEGTTDDRAELAPASPPEHTPRRRGLVIGIISACVVVTVIVVAAIVFSPHSSPKADSQGDQGDNGGIALSSVPDPTLQSAVRSADGTSVTFTWKNPKPRSHDTYQWTQEGTQNPPSTTDKPTATVTGLSAGSSVCIDVSIVRSGKTSPNPLKACSP